MSRINWCDDEDEPGQFALWEANCRRSIRGAKGQVALRELEAALVALPSKRLIAEELENGAGDVCAIGAVAKARGLHAADFKADPEYEMEDVGVELGMPRLVAWKVVAQNDIMCESVWEHGRIRSMTPEERYEKLLAWVRSCLITEESEALRASRAANSKMEQP